MLNTLKEVHCMIHVRLDIIIRYVRNEIVAVLLLPMYMGENTIYLIIGIKVYVITVVYV